MGWQVRRRNNEDKVIMTTRGLGNDDPTQGTITSLPDGNWHHVVVQYDGGPGGNRKLWVDGVLDYDITSTNTFLNPAPGFNFAVGAIDNNAAPGANLANFYQGQMDEVCFFHRTLSDDERDALVAGGSGVDTSVPGTYTVRYVSFDPSGNVGIATREVIVDPNPALPVITLNGAADVTLEASLDPYVDPGATVAEGPGGTNPGAPLDANNIVVSGDTVDLGTPGIYRLSYNYSDVPNGTALEVERVVRVEDTVGPTITLLGDPVITLDLGDELIDPGATATDLISGTVTAFPSAIPGQGLVGRWSFDDPSNPGKDDSGMLRDVTLVNGPLLDNFDTPVPGGNFLDMSGGDRGAIVRGGTVANDLFDPGTDSFTVGSWVRGWPDGNWEPWISKGGEGGQGWQVRRRNNETNAVLTTRGTGQDDNQPTPVPQDGLWHHVMAVYDRATNIKTVYVDGVAGPPSPATNTNPVTPATAFALAFGSRDNGGEFLANWSRVAIDDVQIYRTALTPEQIADLADPLTGVDFFPKTPAVGEHTITYTAVDAAGNVSTAERTVIVVGPPPPMPRIVSYSLNETNDSGAMVLEDLTVGQTYHITSSSSGKNFFGVDGTEFVAAAADEIRLIPADVLADPTLLYKVALGVLPPPPVIIDLPLMEDFEADNGSFVQELFAVGANPAPAGIWTYGASGDGGSMAWSVDGGEGLYEDWLTTPYLRVPANGPVTLEFDHSYNFEANWDGAVVMVSVNNGPFTLVDDFTQNGYNQILRLDSENDYGYPGDLNGVIAFGDISGGFLHSVTGLGTLSAGDLVQVRFRGFWDWGTVNAAPNWVIDNVQVTQTP
jgi:hypothetical protein